jgi:multidrug efflux pump subunit AcrA (membrane-fusion protein)
MLPLPVCVLSLFLAGADPSPNELRIDSALLSLIEHADISARDAGVLTHLFIREGETIAEGKPIAQIDDQEPRLLRDRAETELKVARALADNDIKVRFAHKTAEVADAELKRAQESNVKFPKSVSQTELDRLKLLADKSVLEIEQAAHDQEQLKLAWQVKKHDLDRAVLQVERRTITAPFPGMVVQWKKQRGEWVEFGAPVARLIRLNRLRVEAFLAANSLPPNLVGRPVMLLVNQSEKPAAKFEGKLVFVHPEIDPVNGQVRIWAEIDNTDLALRPGQQATLVIDLTREQ